MLFERKLKQITFSDKSVERCSGSDNIHTTIGNKSPVLFCITTHQFPGTGNIWREMCQDLAAMRKTDRSSASKGNESRPDNPNLSGKSGASGRQVIVVVGNMQGCDRDIRRSPAITQRQRGLSMRYVADVKYWPGETLDLRGQDTSGHLHVKQHDTVFI